MKIILKLVELVFTLIEKILGVVFDILGFIARLIFSRSKKQEKYDADFMQTWKLLGSRKKGFYLGSSNIDKIQSYNGVILYGASGSFKTSSGIIPSIYSIADSSMVVLDVSGEIFEKTSGVKKRQDFAIRTLDFSNPTVSDGYNRLASVGSSTSSEIPKIAHTLVQNSLGGNSHDQFWNIMAESVIGIAISLVLEQEKQYHNLPNVLHLINMMNNQSEAIDLMASKAPESVFNEYKSFIAYDQKLISNVLATSKASLKVFGSPSIGLVSSVNTIDLDSLRETKTILYLKTKITEQSAYAPAVALFFEDLFSRIMNKTPSRRAPSLFILLDETACFRLPELLPTACAAVRKNNTGLFLVLQDHSQLIHNYGRHHADTIRATIGTEMYFPGMPIDTARELEARLGKHEFLDENGHRRVMPIMSADSLIRMKDKALLLVGANPPVLTSIKPYFKNNRFRGYSKIPPPVMPRRIPFDTVPLIPLQIPKS